MRGVLIRLLSTRALANDILLVRTPLSHRRFSPLDGDEGASCSTAAHDAGQTLENIRIYALSANAAIERRTGSWCALLSDLHVCYPCARGYDDSEHCSGPAFCERHARKIAALASCRNGEQTQGVTSILLGSSGALLQGKCLVEDGTDARRSFLSDPLSNTIYDCSAVHANVYYAWCDVTINM